MAAIACGCSDGSSHEAVSASGISTTAVTRTASARSRSSIPDSAPRSASPSTTSESPTSSDPAAVAARFEGVQPHEWGTDVDGVSTRLDTTSPILALTFDACGGPHGAKFDAGLIDLLVHEQLPATLFLNGRWIDANPGLAELLAAHPLFELANHGTHHRPLSVTGRSAYGITGCASAAEVVDEIASNHERLRAITGRAPRFFRSGTAYYDEVGAQIVSALGEVPVSFAVNGDAGATFSAPQIVRSLAHPPPGAIVLMHMNHPTGSTAAGLAAALPNLRTLGVEFVGLSTSGLSLRH